MPTDDNINEAAREVLQEALDKAVSDAVGAEYKEGTHYHEEVDELINLREDILGE